MIYLPDDDFSKECVVILDKDTVRAYQINPYDLEVGDLYYYRDYYINSHYIFKDDYDILYSSSVFGSCIDENNLTNIIYYRNDIFEILALLVLIVGVCWFLVSKLYKTFMRGGKAF